MSDSSLANWLQKHRIDTWAQLSSDFAHELTFPNMAELFDVSRYIADYFSDFGEAEQKYREFVARTQPWAGILASLEMIAWSVDSLVADDEFGFLGRSEKRPFVVLSIIAHNISLICKMSSRLVSRSRYDVMMRYINSLSWSLDHVGAYGICSITSDLSKCRFLRFGHPGIWPAQRRSRITMLRQRERQLLEWFLIEAIKEMKLSFPFFRKQWILNLRSNGLDFWTQAWVSTIEDMLWCYLLLLHVMTSHGSCQHAPEWMHSRFKKAFDITDTAFPDQQNLLAMESFCSIIRIARRSKLKQFSQEISFLVQLGLKSSEAG